MDWLTGYPAGAPFHGMGESTAVGLYANEVPGAETVIASLGCIK